MEGQADGWVGGAAGGSADRSQLETGLVVTGNEE